MRLHTTSIQGFGREREREGMYKILRAEQQKHKNQGPTYIIGDFNARGKRARTADEWKGIGQHTFHVQSASPLAGSEEVMENRQLFINFCLQENTWL